MLSPPHFTGEPGCNVHIRPGRPTRLRAIARRRRKRALPPVHGAVHAVTAGIDAAEVLHVVPPGGR